MTEQDLTRLRIAVAEQVLNSTLDWDHTYQKSVIGDDPKADTQTCNNGRGIWMSCSGCELNGPANEVDWTQRCKAPHTVNYPVDLKAAWQVLDRLILTGWFAQLNVGQGNFCILKTYDSAGCVSRSAAGEASDMPMAICLAAYKAVTGKDWK